MTLLDESSGDDVMVLLNELSEVDFMTLPEGFCAGNFITLLDRSVEGDSGSVRKEKTWYIHVYSYHFGK